MVAIAKLIAISLTLIDVRVDTLDGRVTDGSLQKLDTTSILVSLSDGESKAIPLSDVLELNFTNADRGSIDNQAPMQGLLRIGSRIDLSEATASAETATLQSPVFGELTIPRTDVRALRLQELKLEWQPQWDAFLERNNEKDLLIVAKRDGTGLDFLTGVVSKIESDTVPFLLDGDEIPVPRSRVFGIVFKAAEKSAPTVNAVALKINGGGLVHATNLNLNSEQLEFQSPWGQQLSLAVDRLSSIDFSGGRLHYLSDLEPLSERYFGLDPPDKKWGTIFDDDAATRMGLSSQWRFSRDRFPNNGRPPLMLDQQVYQKGLCIFPSAAIEYALDGHYSRFTAVVGIDDDVAFNQQKGRPPTAVELRIEVDGKEVLKKLIHAPDKPFPLELEMNGATTLLIIVDFGDGESTCDYLDLADARLIIATEQK